MHTGILCNRDRQKIDTIIWISLHTLSASKLGHRQSQVSLTERVASGQVQRCTCTLSLDTPPKRGGDAEVQVRVGRIEEPSSTEEGFPEKKKTGERDWFGMRERICHRAKEKKCEY